MSDGRTIAKNAAWLLVATTGQKLLAFVSFTVAARLVGPFVIGEYFYAVAVTSTFVIIADLGLTPVVIRAIAAGAEEGRRLLSAALRLKVILIPVAILASLAFVIFGRASQTIVITTAIATLVMSADALSLLFYGALRGRQRLQFEAAGMFVGQVLTASVAITAAILGWGAPGLALALLAASSWNAWWAWTQGRGQQVTPLKPHWGDAAMLVKQAVPFALAGIFVKVYSYLDSIMLKAFHGEAAVGTYSVAYKVTYALQFLPLVFIAALFPALSAVHASGDKAALKRIFAGSLRLMAIAGAGLAAGLSALAPRFIPLVYGNQFLGSVAPLGILPWVLLPIFLDFPIGSLLNATHRAHWKTTAMGATMVVNAIMNALLVPSYGPVGASWAGVVSFWFLMLVGTFMVWNDLPSPGWFASLLGRALFVAGGTWYAILNVGAIMPFALDVLFGVAIAGTLLLVTQLLTFDDVRVGYGWLLRRVKGPDPTEEAGNQI
ncbi:hypothetical protein A3E39_02500 [Candidatus Uhrbacteria bacterium RIFCSPHIGHO2_12_FULL_60_25]|uniref:Uncharacterized protein n=1 Tax=Candidatus Uhrbacteria bacterium RIFCSPHIGHO2_12_FULL_60_25 TaxID=1802399 RepID=A0A1F7ULD5_9BACT|nr:MAG: hypothetical protein A3D73_00565 [Candidatus Uhrbacteria bacterium RIFCSPHIGHO2_02_FULL_60_44]OGL79092.1 MAG: hypothetical protein A3E39_02500 [Candidatus Uhrbacteria bacterium RIFCSPHIGHO2_12_FULL_60_25]